VNDLEEGHSRGELQELVMVCTRTTPWYQGFSGGPVTVCPSVGLSLCVRSKASW